MTDPVKVPEEVEILIRDLTLTNGAAENIISAVSSALATARAEALETVIANLIACGEHRAVYVPRSMLTPDPPDPTR